MTYEAILTLSRASLNDQSGGIYTNTILLPYLNLARIECEEIFEQNNIPVTNEESDVITVSAGDTTVTYPSDLVEIRQLWESVEGLNTFVPMTKREFLTGISYGEAQRSNFYTWAWIGQEIKVLESTVDIDVKIDYIKSLFTLLTISDVSENNNVLKTDLFFAYRTGGLAAEFIGENPTRALTLNGNAMAALERSLGISIKSKQTIVTRRRPFREAFKARRRLG